MPKSVFVGKSVPRKEARSKITGEAKYVDDLSFPGMIYGVTVRSPVARGRLKKILFEGDLPWNEITKVTSQDIKDIPGENCVAVILKEQPMLVDDMINHPEEPIVLLAHPDRALLEKARKNVKFEIEPLPSVLSIDDALSKKTIVWGSDNILKSYLVEKGDIQTAFAQADLIVEGEYTTGAQEQLYIEPNGMIAVANPKDGVTVWGSLQCPFYVHKALKTLFGFSDEKIRVIQVETGGGFGGKEDYPSLIASHAALLAWKSGRPVKIIYDRAEDMAATTKRHPSRTRHKTAVSKDGKILGMDIDFVLDGGAYLTLSSVVLSRGTIHATGPYVCPHVRIKSCAVATNTPPHGAFRGFGAPQSIFALERHLDVVAGRLGIAPEEFRRRNFIHQGEQTATSQTIREPVNFDKLLDQALEMSRYHDKIKRFEIENQKSPIKKGMGFACFMHGSGFTGSGEVYLASVAGVEVTPEGRIRVLASSTEMGQGKNTVFAQIVAEALGIDVAIVDVAQPDTAVVPNSGPTVASRTTSVVGKLVEDAARGLVATLKQSGFLGATYSTVQFQEACLGYLGKFGALKTLSQYKAPPGIFWDDEKYRGDAYGTFAWAVYVAEVSVDTRTFEVKVDDFVAVQEIGRVVNPVLAQGQIEGGVIQGIGYAIYENVVWKEGRMANNRMTNYIIPTAVDVPRVQVHFEETPYAYGAAGSKGIGELPMDGPAPAVINAISNATGVSYTQIPLMPENIMEDLTRSLT
ncbi:xanthine dehydrogenase family protein molybdopterin-binding subunit [Bdellovibrionota bacterium FG-2]